jgi:hypothetical protein
MFVVGVLSCSIRWWYLGTQPIGWRELAYPNVLPGAGERPILLLVVPPGGSRGYIVGNAAVDTPAVRRLIASKGVIPFRADKVFQKTLDDMLAEGDTYPFVVLIPADALGDPAVIASLQDSDERVVTALRGLP